MNAHVDGYKVLGVNGRAIHGGTGSWLLPALVNTGRTSYWKAGGWMPPIADISPCMRGYHYAPDVEALIEWLRGDDIYVYAVQRHPDATVIADDSKVVCSRARLLYRCRLSGKSIWNTISMLTSIYISPVLATNGQESVSNLYRRIVPMLGRDLTKEEMEQLAIDIETVRDLTDDAVLYAALEAVFWAIDHMLHPGYINFPMFLRYVMEMQKHTAGGDEAAEDVRRRAVALIRTELGKA